MTCYCCLLLMPLRHHYNNIRPTFFELVLAKCLKTARVMKLTFHTRGVITHTHTLTLVFSDSVPTLRRKVIERHGERSKDLKVF